MKLAINEIMPEHELNFFSADDLKAHIKRKMMHKLADALIDRQLQYIKETKDPMTGRMNLYYAVEILSDGEFEHTKRVIESKAKMDARPKIIDDFGNEVTP